MFIGVLGILPLVSTGCGGEGAGTEGTPPVEGGGRSRLKKMSELTSKAIEKAAKKK
jgi:hypothetical protein